MTDRQTDRQRERERGPGRSNGLVASVGTGNGATHGRHAVGIAAHLNTSQNALPEVVRRAEKAVDREASGVRREHGDLAVLELVREGVLMVPATR